MGVARWIRPIAGTFLLTSLALSRPHGPYWLLFTAFVGVNLSQSALTCWCPREGVCADPWCGMSGTEEGSACR